MSALAGVGIAAEVAIGYECRIRATRRNRRQGLTLCARPGEE